MVKNGYKPGVLEIDDRWQSRYGDLEFDPAKFPDPRAGGVFIASTRPPLTVIHPE